MSQEIREKAAAAVRQNTSRSGTGEVAPQYVLSSLRYWDVGVSPTKKRVVAGRWVPSVRGVAFSFLSKKRRITIELYKPVPFHDQQSRGTTNQEQTKKLFGQLLKGVSSSSLLSVPAMGDDDLAVFRILKPKPGNDPGSAEDDGDWDSHSISEMSFNSGVSSRSEGDDADFEASNIRWKERFRCRLDMLEVLEHKGKSCDMKLGSNSTAIVKTMNFESKSDLQTFLKVLHQMNELREERGRRLANNYRQTLLQSSSSLVRPKNQLLSNMNPFHSPKDNGGSKKYSPRVHDILEVFTIGDGQEETEVSTGPQQILPKAPTTTSSQIQDVEKNLLGKNMVQLLIEIVSASNLPIADIAASDPYVKVFDGADEIHRTGVVYNTLNPVWTVATKSLLLIQKNLEDFFQGSNFITFSIKDYDAFTKNDTLGTVDISKDNLLRGTGERLEYDILVPGKSSLRTRETFMASTLALRYRQATDEDVMFMLALKENQARGLDAVYSDETFVPLRDHKVKLMKKMQRKVGRNKIKEYRIKPFPDPERESETTWMTKKDIHWEAKQPSRYWIASGSGELGRVFVELLWCDGLPDLDMSITGRDKTDAFACIIFEDCIAHTDVINDTLSPRWMPWSQRAFVFDIMHPSSQLMVGIYDFDAGIADGGHDFVGRAVVNLANLRPGTLYTQTYILHETSREDREPRGTVTLRLRVEYPDPRKALLACLQPIFNHDVSVAERRYFLVAHNTITHGEQPSVLSLALISSYVQELQSYLDVLFYIRSAVSTVLLWRGHYPVTFRVPVCPTKEANGTWRWTRPITIKLPLHSVVLFLCGISLARNFNLFPAFLIFTIGWFLLATNELTSNDPSPHRRPRSYLEILRLLMFNFAGSPMKIKPNENLNEIKAFAAEKEEVRRAREEVVKTIEMEQKKYEAYIQAETTKMEEEVDITTKKRGGISALTLAPFRGLLLPLQRILHAVCVALRVSNSIVVWRDSHVSFWLASSCFLAAFILAWIPWGFLISWAFKISVWLLLGPWMKLLDIFYFQRLGCENEMKKQDLAEQFHNQYVELIGENRTRKLLKETALKMKEMKKYMFGHYLMRVPVFKEERYFDDPIPSSFAEPFDPTKFGEVNVIERKFGQYLEGEMIPKRNVKARKVAEEVRIAKQDAAYANSMGTSPVGGDGETSSLLLPRLDEDYGSLA